MTPSPLRSIEFPTAWESVFDGLLTEFVKDRYLPKRYARKGAFNDRDWEFFLESVKDLHERFTSRRSSFKDEETYFHHPRFRSAYLLYFMPLQAAKFRALFQLYPEPVRIALKDPAMKILDFGAGPGTASLAFLATALEMMPDGQAIHATLVWVDSDRAILGDGLAFFEAWRAREPRLANVRVELRANPWWKETAPLSRLGASLAFFGHVLNEGLNQDERVVAALSPIVHRKGVSGGTVFLEPAAPDSARHLSRLRDLLLAGYPDPPGKPPRPWGPCLHAGACPLAYDRDWCHFSYPAKVPGKWHARFSRSISRNGKEREWLKFSDLWLPSPDSPPKPLHDPTQRLVVSDQIPPGDWLICEPERPRKIKSRKGPLGRGVITTCEPTQKTASPRVVPRPAKKE